MANTLEDILREGLNQLVSNIILASEEAGQRASGKTYSQIRPETLTVGEYVQGSVYAPSYFYTLIRGRGPGNIPANMADIIIEWAGYKGISFATPQEMLRFGNAVAWKIRREGSELYRNHLYIDIVDTPIRVFEEWLEGQLDNIMDLTITAAFNAENFEGHGFII